MSRPDRILNLLGLSVRGHNAVSGAFAVEKAVKGGEARLLVLASDASENAKKDYKNLCEFYEVPLVIYSDKDHLGHAIGKQQRVCIAITDQGLAKRLKETIDQTGSDH